MRSHPLSTLSLILVLCSAHSNAGAQSFPGSCDFLHHGVECTLPQAPDAACTFACEPGAVIDSAFVWYIASTGHCASLSAEFWVDGAFVETTGFVDPGESSPAIDITELVRDQASALVELRNPVAGPDACDNSCCCPDEPDKVVGWAGTIHCEGSVLLGSAVPGSIASPSPELTLVPQPYSRGEALIRIAEHLGPAISIYIVDTSGRLIRDLTETHSASPFEPVWDGTDDGGAEAPSGIYIVAARTKERFVSQKFIVVR